MPVCRLASGSTSRLRPGRASRRPSSPGSRSRARARRTRISRATATRSGSTPTGPSRAPFRCTTRPRGGCTCSISAACRWRRSPVYGAAGWSRTTPASSWPCWPARASILRTCSTACSWSACASGCAPGTRKLENATQELLGTEMPKGQQRSAWGAERLSLEQVRYAAADAAAAHMISRAVWPRLGTCEREVFWLSNAVVPIAAAMQIAGVPFDVAVHHERIATWETALAAARRSFVELTGDEVPKLGPQRRAWLEQRLPEDELARWPRTTAGHLSTKADDMARLADRPEIAALLKVDAEDKKLRDFGRKLVDLVNPDTLRLHPSWMPCAAKTGRFACSNPNMQQLPKKERHAIVAPPERLFVIADYSQLELRVAAELAARGSDARGICRRWRSAPGQCGVVRRLHRGPGLRGGPLQGQGSVLRDIVRPRLARPGADGLERLAAGAGARGSRTHPGNLLPSLSAAARLAAGATRIGHNAPDCCARSRAGHSGPRGSTAASSGGPCAATTRSRARRPIWCWTPWRGCTGRSRASTPP